MGIGMLMKLFCGLWAVIGIAVVILVIQIIRDKIKEPNSKFKKWQKQRKENKEKKKLAKDDSKRQIKKHNKNKNAINFKALKFEYSQVYSLINSVVANQIRKGITVSEVYLIRFDEFYKKVNSYNKDFGGEFSLITLACLVKAIISEPLLKGKEEDTNLKILDSIIEAFVKKGITHTGGKNLMKFDELKLRKELQDCFRLYSDDVFLVALYVNEKVKTLK